MTSIREMQDAVHKLAVSKGWWEDIQSSATRAPIIPEQIALMHSELSEALEDYRNPDLLIRDICYYEEDGAVCVRQRDIQGKLNKPIGFGSELADTVIRIMNLCGHLGIDLERAIQEKHAYNETRPHRHGGKRC